MSLLTPISSLSMSGEPGSTDWTHLRRVVTFLDDSPCLNDVCLFIKRRRAGALVRDGNFDVRIAKKKGLVRT